jgi:predicted alpha/beta-hydrolase family hydrolase
MRRAVLLVAALTIPASAATVALSSPAWAKVEKSIKCTSLSGPATGTIVVSGCNGNTGGGATVSGAALAAGGTITWNNSATTTIAAPTLKSSKSLTKKCVTLYGAGTIEDSFTAAVTADTTGLKKLGTAKGAICLDPSGNIHALKPLVTT